MQTLRDDYLTRYHNLKLTRDADGVLVAEFHSNGGPFIMVICLPKPLKGFADTFKVLFNGVGANLIPGQ